MNVRNLPMALWMLVASLTLPAAAAPHATVDALVSPAWIERNKREQPLAVGMEVKSGDRIRTGDGARVYLKTADGGTVKLGADAKMTFFTRGLKPREFFRATLDVASGAFRYTTAALAKYKPRDVSIRVGTATIGIRGTDVWGKSDKDRDLVMLLEGAIVVERAEEVVEMTEPMTAFIAPRGELALAIEPVPPEVVEARARETEIATGAGSLRRGGKWSVLLGAVASEGEALELYDIARGEGYPARIRPRAAEGEGRVYRVAVDGFVDKADAAAAAVRFKEATGLEAEVLRR